MDLIDKHLATAALNNTYEPSIKAALAIGKNVLNNYYNMTDHSELYCISMGIFFKIKIQFISFINISLQSFTLVTNFSILNWPVGIWSGSRQQRKLCAQSLDMHMLKLRMIVKTLMADWYVPYLFTHAQILPDLIFHFRMHL